MQLRGFIVGHLTTHKKVIRCKKDRRPLWLIKVIYAVQRDAICGSLESCMLNIKVQTQKMIMPFLHFETDRQTTWLTEILYAIKRNLLGFNGPLGRLHAKKSCMQNKDLTQEKVKPSKPSIRKTDCMQ